MSEKKALAKAREWLKSSDNDIYLIGHIGAAGDVLCALLAAYAAEKDRRIAELESLNGHQADSIGGYIDLVQAAKNAGIQFAWEETPIGKKALAYNTRAEERCTLGPTECANHSGADSEGVCSLCRRNANDLFLPPAEVKK
jgi:hypothetical protein